MIRQFARARGITLITEETNGGFFLYCFSEMAMEADTWHQTLDDAKHQAEFQFGLTEWTDVPATVTDLQAWVKELAAEAQGGSVMSEKRTIVSNEPALRQIRNHDGLRAMFIVRSAGGFRFVEETYSHEKDDVVDLWYWEPTHESGIYATQQEALADAIKTLPWLRNSN